MIRLLRLCLALAFVVSAFAQEDDPAQLQVRLLTHLTSYGSKTGTPFRCVVIAPYQVNGEVLIPQGSTLYGVVRWAKPVRLGLIRERASLALDFLGYETPEGESYHFEGKLAQIENAREEVTSRGIIRGVIAANNPNQLVNGLWRNPRPDVFYRSLLGLTGLSAEVLERWSFSPIGPAVRVGLRSLLPFPEPEIHLPPGTDLNLTVDRKGTQFSQQSPQPVSQTPGELADWIAEQPSNIENARGKPVSDLINVLFVGTRQEVINAFTVSGWFAPDRRSSRTLTRSYLAYNRMAQYPQAPVSTLLYRGQAPDLTFEKSLDTVAKRHHIRIWQAGIFEGKTVWLGAATHDTGLCFNRATFLPTHAIDTRLDAERSKVGVDLAFAGCSEPLTYTSREKREGPSRRLAAQTDGRVAVLALRSCSSAPLDPATALEPTRPGNGVTRIVRRIILEARSYVLRENVYYWTFQAGRHYWQAHLAAEAVRP